MSESTFDYFGFSKTDFATRMQNPRAAIGLLVENKGCGPTVDVFTFRASAAEFMEQDENGGDVRFLCANSEAKIAVHMVPVEDCVRDGCETPGDIWRNYRDVALQTYNKKMGLAA